MTAPRPRTSLVTGGGGFIGSHLVDRLLGRGDHVVVIDDFSTGRRVNVAGWPPERVEVIEGDVSTVIGHLASDAFDEIYHLAAAVGVQLVIDKPIHTIETNVQETSRVLRFAAASRTPFLLASTSEVYGKGVRMPFREDDDVVYGATTLHRWSYACSKAIDEYLALAHAREHELPVVVARFFNTVGPRQVGAYGMVLPRFVAAAAAGAPLLVHGDGEQTRCFCDVRDVAALLPEMLASDACRGRVINVGHDEPISIIALARRVVDVLGSSSAIELIPYDQVFGAGFDDLRDRVPDLTRLRTLTGFTPRFTLDDTIRDLAAQLEADVSAESTA